MYQAACIESDENSKYNMCETTLYAHVLFPLVEDSSCPGKYSISLNHSPLTRSMVMQAYAHALCCLMTFSVVI